MYWTMTGRLASVVAVVDAGEWPSGVRCSVVAGRRAINLTLGRLQSAAAQIKAMTLISAI